MALFLWLLLCAFVGYCADRKGWNMWAWGMAALVLSPLIVGIVLALTPEEDDRSNNYSSQQLSSEDWEDDKQEEKHCPECGYVSDSGEQFCPRCGEMLWCQIH